MAQHDNHSQAGMGHTVYTACLPISVIRFSRRSPKYSASTPPVYERTVYELVAGARGEATDQVTFDLLEVRGRRPQVSGQTSDGGNFPRSCELAESPATVDDNCAPFKATSKCLFVSTAGFFGFFFFCLLNRDSFKYYFGICMHHEP
jgi:hypothetical protein